MTKVIVNGTVDVTGQTEPHEENENILMMNSVDPVETITIFINEVEVQVQLIL